MLTWLLIAVLLFWFFGMPTKRKSKGKGRGKARSSVGAGKGRSTIKGGSYFSPELQAYYKSPDWQKKRSQVFAKYGRKCKVCGTSERLEIDHLRYPARGSGIEAFKRQGLGDFQVLCHTHHAQKTSSDRRSKRKRSG